MCQVPSNLNKKFTQLRKSNVDETIEISSDDEIIDVRKSGEEERVIKSRKEVSEEKIVVKITDSESSEDSTDDTEHELDHCLEYELISSRGEINHERLFLDEIVRVHAYLDVSEEEIKVLNKEKIRLSVCSTEKHPYFRLLSEEIINIAYDNKITVDFRMKYKPPRK